MPGLMCGLEEIIRLLCGGGGDGVAEVDEWVGAKCRSSYV